MHVAQANAGGGLQAGYNASGDIHATRTVTGVASPPPISGWYLNIHLGNSNQILSGGNPTLAFQPLLCADIDQIPNAPTAVPVGSHGEHFLSAGQTVVLGTVGHFTFGSTCSKDGTGQDQVTFDVTANTTADTASRATPDSQPASRRNPLRNPSEPGRCAHRVAAGFGSRELESARKACRQWVEQK